MSYVDLRDLEGAEKRRWKKAIEDQTGYDFDELAENEPTMIPDYGFKAYAEELAYDIGMIDQQFANNWPATHIDWKAAAEDLKYDYTNVEVDGVEYWFRAF